MSLVLADVQPTENPKITEITVLKDFEGMTNGEVIKALFPNSEVIFSLNNVPKSDVIKIDNEAFLVERSWWDSPYKGVSE